MSRRFAARRTRSQADACANEVLGGDKLSELCGNFSTHQLPGRAKRGDHGAHTLNDLAEIVSTPKTTTPAREQAKIHHHSVAHTPHGLVDIKVKILSRNQVN